MKPIYNTKILLSIVLLLVLQSCVSKKQMLYLQDVETVNSQEVTYNNHTLQVDDILKISVGALMPEAALPYNNITAGSVVANNIDVMKLDGYLVSQNSTINFPVLGELSVKEKVPGRCTSPKIVTLAFNKRTVTFGDIK